MRKVGFKETMCTNHVANKGLEQAMEPGLLTYALSTKPPEAQLMRLPPHLPTESSRSDFRQLLTGLPSESDQRHPLCHLQSFSSSTLGSEGRCGLVGAKKQ